jgi:hypothetical protein
MAVALQERGNEMKSIKFILALSAVIVLAGISVQYEPAQIAQPVSYDTYAVLGIPTTTTTALPIAVRFQEAFAGSTVLAGSPQAVSTTKMYAFSNPRPRMIAVNGDTGGVKIKVPGMAVGDIITGVYYVPWDSLAELGFRAPLDLASFSLFYRDTLQCWGEVGGNEGGPATAIDSGTIHIMYMDITD